MPFFSIVIPTFNRSGEIARALSSCLSQGFLDFEIIVVDDKSTDNTVELIRKNCDRRVNLVCHDANRGVCPARNTGVSNAKGEWVIFLDSDDEFVPGALGSLHACAREVSTNVARIASMCRRDDNKMSPDLWTGGEFMDYERYIKWTDSVKISDFNNCIRRETFDRVKLPRGRAYEALYHLDFAQHFTTFTRLEPTVLVHTDARNRTSNLTVRQLMSRSIEDAPAALAGFHEILTRHGDALQRWAPNRFQLFFRALITSQLLTNNYREGIFNIRRYICRHPTSFGIWVLLLLSAFGRQGVALGKAIRGRS